MAYLGQDTDQVRQFAKQLDGKANDINGLISQLTSAVQAVDWKGADAQQFISDWNGTHVPGLKKVVSALNTAAAVANRNAAEQDAASK
ncbi:WXG100 family type VII secretion target [Mycolicibacter sp. MYC123]|uniref:WXG100 family type VII secretion target n=1 Tax=[Mycobacterium] zoologicum TaxID=2872311 RepID=A0ABU5YR45_9MYCO|nr:MULTISPECIES: WXG100 family type VII secretion target [unclassified Mycolicibacter]MEB3052350.1 WXG100 family type VII secretion target [Mycolicibacter sp. MYC123]MEB3062229.1 WXG100 family type VII secretion target [Mycolicibacter sp. MYC101]